MTTPNDDATAAEVRAARDEYADEDAEAAELEAAQNAAALDVTLSLRINHDLDAELRRRAAAEEVSPSALVRRLLRSALQQAPTPALTVEQVEEIARRVVREAS
jgi:predicted HicB family RNase H-like nuclease